MICQENKPKIGNATLFVAALSVCLGFALLGVSPQVLAFQLETAENVRLLRHNQEFEAAADSASSENIFVNDSLRFAESAGKSLQARLENCRTCNLTGETSSTLLEKSLDDFLALPENFLFDAPAPNETLTRETSLEYSPEFFAETFARRLFQTPSNRARGAI